jgi:hypothetical protein
LISLRGGDEAKNFFSAITTQSILRKQVQPYGSRAACWFRVVTTPPSFSSMPPSSFRRCCGPYTQGRKRYYRQWAQTRGAIRTQLKLLKVLKTYRRSGKTRVEDRRYGSPVRSIQDEQCRSEPGESAPNEVLAWEISMLVWTADGYSFQLRYPAPSGHFHVEKAVQRLGGMTDKAGGGHGIVLTAVEIFESMDYLVRHIFSVWPNHFSSMLFVPVTASVWK